MSAMNDLMSGQDNIYSPHGGSPGAAGNWEENEFDARQQYNGALLGELASQKQKYNKKFTALEKVVDQLRLEKQQLAQVLES